LVGFNGLFRSPAARRFGIRNGFFGFSFGHRFLYAEWLAEKPSQDVSPRGEGGPEQRRMLT
jgi:hypothetical protein